MKIKYLGHSSFKVTGKTSTGENATLIIDPFDPKETGLSFTKQQADIVTLSHDHGDHNFLDKIEGKSEDGYVLFNTPGEYETHGLRMYGLASYHDNKKGAERGKNTIFIYDFEEATIAHLGDIGHTLEDSELLEHLDNVDILMVPTGGVYTIDHKKAVNVIEAIEPSVVIPMHFRTPQHTDAYKELSTFEDFTGEIGSQTEQMDAYSIKSHNELPPVLTVLKLAS